MRLLHFLNEDENAADREEEDEPAEDHRLRGFKLSSDSEIEFVGREPIIGEGDVYMVRRG